jgi:hypothetical protein
VPDRVVSWNWATHAMQRGRHADRRPGPGRRLLGHLRGRPAQPATAAIPREISVAVAVCCSAAAEIVGEISRFRSTTAP